jgi:hypothetical protein
MIFNVQPWVTPAKIDILTQMRRSVYVRTPGEPYLQRQINVTSNDSNIVPFYTERKNNSWWHVLVRRQPHFSGSDCGFIARTLGPRTTDDSLG